MTNNVVPMHPVHPMRPGVVEIDDSRLQSLWTRHYRRNMLLASGAVVTGLLLSAAVLIMALRLNNEPPKVEITNTPPVVNIPAPVVNVTPQIEVKLPPQATASNPVFSNARTPDVQRPGETSKVVTGYEIFHNVTAEGVRVETGWAYRASTDPSPYHQHCQARPDNVTSLLLAENMGEGMKLNSNLDREARQAGVDVAKAHRLVSSCRWFS